MPTIIKIKLNLVLIVINAIDSEFLLVYDVYLFEFLSRTRKFVNWFSQDS
ncbi:hypothetical protein NIES4071_62560 [Calothrix sp. NIES-4071]|nr:hypothetical protein NIES4071_62560 [Calothrix sp. NIES-4071]BAZ60559.1 hypothetical protein NIES4105_62510 [Calothrix sp. NIES-4105]